MKFSIIPKVLLLLVFLSASAFADSWQDRSGALIFKLKSVPDDISELQIRLEYDTTNHSKKNFVHKFYFSRLSESNPFPVDEIADVRIKNIFKDVAEYIVNTEYKSRLDIDFILIKKMCRVLK